MSEKINELAEYICEDCGVRVNDVRVLWNHDADYTLSRTKSKTVAAEKPAEQVEAELHQQAVEAFKVALADLPDACCQQIYEWLHKLGHRIYRE